MVEISKIRLDKWLWATRFFKTRSLATTAINGGKVHLNNRRTKPAKEVKVNDIIFVRTGFTERTIIVQGLSIKRGSAKIAVLLYKETVESIAKREEIIHQRSIINGQREHGSGRPTKKDRRIIHKFTTT
jgi:ribosome-associated heat shock protein Hsp15